MLSVCVTAALTLIGAYAPAQSGPDGWQFTIAPYMVAAGMDGSIGIAGFEAEVDVPFSTILDNLDLAAMVHFNMMNERWVISSDLIFMDLEDDEAVTGGTATATMEETLFEVAGGYRASPVVTLLAGARWVDLGPYAEWGAPARLYANVARAYREFRNEPADAPWDMAKSFDAIYAVARTRGLEVEL